MEAGESRAKLSELLTQTTLLYQAQNGPPEQADAAKQLLMLRYSGAIHRYLLKVVGDAEVARDLNQEFSVKFLEGKFRHFDPTRGRFRDYLKRALRNLMVDHFRKRQGAAQLDAAMEADIVGEVGLGDFDKQFLASWRQDLLARAWDALRAYEENTGKPFHAVMRLRLARPSMRSPELAEELARKIGRPMTAGNLRQVLHRARDKFTEFLIDEVQVSLKQPTREAVEEELGDLELLELCRPALAKRKFEGDPS